MSQECYVNQILTPYVLPWLVRGDDFILEEDGDSGHGYSRGKEKKVLVKEWKKRHGLKTYQNCAGAPDFAIIENSWQVPKQEVKKYTHNDIEQLRVLALEGWQKLEQKTINKWVEEMPKRLKDCIKAEGKMTGH